MSKQAIDVVKQYLGICLTTKLINDILQDNPDLRVDLNKGIDTYNRDWLLDSVAEKLVGRPCPRNGDGKQNAESFATDILKACRKQGIKIA